MVPTETRRTLAATSPCAITERFGKKRAVSLRKWGLIDEEHKTVG